jgi:hypothetical protein
MLRMDRYNNQGDHGNSPEINREPNHFTEAASPHSRGLTAIFRPQPQPRLLRLSGLQFGIATPGHLAVSEPAMKRSSEMMVNSAIKRIRESVCPAAPKWSGDAVVLTETLIERYYLLPF